MPGLSGLSGLSGPSGIFGGRFVGAYDDIANIVHIYEPARRVLTAYTGNLVRLRRASDNAELNFGYIANGNLDVAAIAAFAASLPNLLYYELLPFHGMAAGKYDSLDLDYRARDLRSPSKERLEALYAVAREYGVTARHG